MAIFGIEHEKIPEMKEIIKNYKRLDMNLKDADQRAERERRTDVLNKVHDLDG